MILLITAGCAEQPLNDRPQLMSVKDRMRFERQAKYIQPDFDTSTQDNASNDSDFETVWERMISLYALPEVDNVRVDRELNWLLSRPDYIARVQERAEPYMYSILEEIEAEGLPGELALLPVVESAFRPDAYSPAQAAGLWQFIPATGRLFGLKQNWWYDGRRDVFASTQAACDFLKGLSETFEGDWFLALASYNAGKGTVGRAIEKNRNRSLPTDYWSLPLPKETQDYVPRLLAVAKLFANADKYNIPLRPIENKPVFEPVEIGSQIDLSKAAEMAHLTMDEFHELNPGFNRSCTAPDGPHRLLIPVEQVEIFKENLAQMSEEDKVDEWQRHKVASGEDLQQLAEKYDTTAHSIRKFNNMGSDYIYPGQYVVIPPRQLASLGSKFTRKKSSAYKTAASKSTSRHNNRSHDVIYTVKRGETFWRISQKFSIKPETLAQWNHLKPQTHVKAGQKLVIKRGKGNDIALAAFSKNPFKSVEYTVKKGDSLSQISRKFNVSVSDLRKWNSSGPSKSLRPGQKIKVKID
ncbi:MAG: LysM peptidoglycan-binding domain-containing protein [Gammaproteobacteria bacterium]